MKFINPTTVVAQMGLKPGNIVADFGSGSGFFAIAAAQMVGTRGLVYAIDVQQAKLTATQSAAMQQGYKNIQVTLANLDKPFTDVDETSVDAVIMASVLHEVNDRAMLLKNAYRLLKTGGMLLAVEWKPEHTLFGPSLDKRISPGQLEQELQGLGLKKVKEIPADTYHYALLFTK